ncbi:MAG: hypothetical protein ABI333_10935 [bacterium]
MSGRSPLPETRLVIASTWDGVALPQSERVILGLGSDGARLRITVDAPFHADPRPPHPAGPTPTLWEHEVVELFVLGTPPPGAPPPYTEVELGPHGHHLVLRLGGVRQLVDELLPLDFRAEVDAAGPSPRWRGVALLEPTFLPPPPHRVNAYAIHGTGDGRRFLALHPVPGAQPDFHRLDRFERLRLPVP